MPRARANEEAWERQLIDEQRAKNEGKKLKEQQREEVANLKTWFEKLESVFGDKTPRDIKSEKDFVRYVEYLHTFFTKVRAMIIRLLREETLVEKNLKEYYSSNSSAIEAVNNVIAKQQIIKKELDSVVRYWGKVKSKSKLPWFYSFNKRKIVTPLKSIEEKELRIISDIDQILSGKRVVVKKGTKLYVRP
jgi:hypothetical protein